MRTVRTCILTVAYLVTSLSLSCVACDDASPSDGRPNILFIFTDDQSYKTLSCYPEAPAWVKTPNIDQLASRGVRFERTYLGAWCMPSRASLLTGRLQHGIQTMRMEGQYPRSVYDPDKCRFWPAELRKNGYHTAQIGKWHTGIDTGYGRDWDHQIVWNRPGQPDNAGNYYYDQVVTFNGVDQQVAGYSTDNYTDWAVEYINGKHRDETKPWYLWLCYGAIHGPTTPADRHVGKLAGQEPAVPIDIFGPWPSKPRYLESTASWQPGDNGKPYRRHKSYDASNFNTNTPGQSFDDWVRQSNECALAVDEGVGRLVAALRETGQLENTLIVFAADQGFALGEHGMNNKVAPYDAAIASPMIVVQPEKIPADKVCRHPINAPDLVRFMADIAQVELPWRTDGRDVSRLMADPETETWDSPMLMTHTGRKYGSDTNALPDEEALLEVGGVPWYVLLRDGRFKYVRYFIEGEIEELYDLESDPEELVNLAVDDQHAERLAQLRRTADEELRRTQAGFVGQMPATSAMAKARAETSNSDSAKSLDGTPDEVRVRIEVKIPDEGTAAAGPVQDVFIAGNIKQLGAWRPDGLKLDPTAANVFGAEFLVPIGTPIQFKVTRGSWQTVERDQFGRDISNREFVATALADGVPQNVSIVVERWGLFRPVPSTATGTLKLHEQVASKYLPRARNVSVWLPPNYGESQQKFPVLYLQDGQNVFDKLTSALGDEWRTDEVALELIEKCEIPPLIIVGVWNTADRMDEYTLTKDERLGAGGRGLDYIRFMTEELKPFIDRTYRTQADRNSTFIGGSSLGGLIAMQAGLQRPDVFGCCLAFSPTLGWDNERLLNSFQSEVKWPADVQLWISMGTREGRDALSQKLNLTRAQRLHELLAPINSQTNRPMQIQYHEFIDATHDERSWAAQFPVALKAIMPNRE